MALTKQKIIFSGGGTLGPVTPLITLKNELERLMPGQFEFLFVGTKSGPERGIVETAGICFVSIFSGKLRRYFSWRNLLDLFLILFGFLQSIFLIKRFRPVLVITAGGFVSVPFHLAARIFGVKSWVHQQDARVGLANRLMIPFADLVTFAFIETSVFINHKNKFRFGNLARMEILSAKREDGLKFFNLSGNRPIVMATGGGTGALPLNELVVSVAGLLPEVDFVHITGRGRMTAELTEAARSLDNYRGFDFLSEEIPLAYAVADLVIGRGGLGTLFELASRSLPTIIIPKPGHQEDNVSLLIRLKAIESVPENSGPEILAEKIKTLLENKDKLRELGALLQKSLPASSPDDLKEIMLKLGL